MEEGVIKYQSFWEQVEILPSENEAIETLLTFRQKLYDINLIGAYPENGIGFGNISIRIPQKVCLITGSQTGHLLKLTDRHISWVERVSIQSNQLWCQGPAKASSESLTHSVLYLLDPNIQAVIHVHHMALWKTMLDKAPTTAQEVPYGTPEMAEEVRLLWEDTDVEEQKIFAMGGHEEGIISFGASMEEAYEVLMKWYRDWQISHA